MSEGERDGEEDRERERDLLAFNTKFLPSPPDTKGVMTCV